MSMTDYKSIINHCHQSLGFCGKLFNESKADKPTQTV